jgi:hypothetical protein
MIACTMFTAHARREATTMRTWAALAAVLVIVGAMTQANSWTSSSARADPDSTYWSAGYNHMDDEGDPGLYGAREGRILEGKAAMVREIKPRALPGKAR